MQTFSEEADRAVNGLEFQLGGPAYCVMRRVRVIKGAGPSVGRRSIAFIAITWFPMLLLSAIEGHAFGPTRQSFLLDYATYARVFIGVPVIFAAESVVGPRIRSAGRQFVDAGIVRPESLPGFSAAIDGVIRRREAWLPEVIFALVAIFGASFISVEKVVGLESPSWHTMWTEEGASLSLAGSRYHLVAMPIMQFLVLRWAWRLLIWTLFLWDVSRLRLVLLPTHTDMAGGLGFLGNAYISLSIFPFALGCVLSAEVAFRARYEGLDLASLKAMAPLLVALHRGFDGLIIS